VYAANGARVARLIGHSSGITALAKYTISQFISASADQTTKLWDVRQPQAIMTLCKHQGIVTTVFGEPSADVVISGGTDGVVRGWDIRGIGRALFAVSIGDSTPQTLHYNPWRQKLTVVVSERTSDIFYDLQKFGHCSELERANTPQCDGILTFQFTLPG
jgi:WD40 repeat protein